jgi:hypothetical protein
MGCRRVLTRLKGVPTLSKAKSTVLKSGTRDRLEGLHDRVSRHCPPIQSVKMTMILTYTHFHHTGCSLFLLFSTTTKFEPPYIYLITIRNPMSLTHDVLHREKPSVLLFRMREHLHPHREGCCTRPGMPQAMASDNLSSFRQGKKRRTVQRVPIKSMHVLHNMSVFTICQKSTYLYCCRNERRPLDELRGRSKSDRIGVSRK